MDAALTSSLGRTILGDSIVTIGRAPDNALVISDPTVSGHHAELRPAQPGYRLVDLGSTNGTFVNERRLTPNLPQKLRPGDICRVGNFTFTYEEYPAAWQDTIGASELTDDDQSLTIEHGNAFLPDDSDEIAYGSTEPPQQQGNNPRSSPPGGADNDESTDTDRRSPDLPGPPQYNPGGTAWDSQQPDQQAPSPDMREPTPPYFIGKQEGQEYLQFAAFYPRVVPVDTWNTLLVYAYIQSALQAIRADAHKFKEQLGPDPFQVDAWASQPMARGEQITIVPTFQGVTFDPERIPFTWTKDWHRAIFSFNADRRWLGAVGSGEILVFSGPLIIASFKISLRFAEQSIQNNTFIEEVVAQRYRKIFTSYSRDDALIVRAIRQAYQAIGDQSFLDVEHLRSGQNWNAELLRMIDSSDIFQLFWSARSAQSQYVRQEYQYALQHYKYDGFIRPVYWEKPMQPPPPQELARLHFAYYELPRLAAADQKNSFFTRLSSLFTRKY